ncbi:hypothetical protein [Pararobbsia alpina]|uniref:Uncharacterized protein n=1 Tax=Pararobbsia alpina TaxID=621374 RepID=A0A6S7BI16_9BURK|nr:hypothetical protein [Pararobbsia alpina]CAB3789353.1 hypothetical protein LMG28138_02748 [Pararobbsia alpina]
MRISFHDASIPTRAVKRLKQRLSLKESQARQITSEVFGYRDWTDLHNELGSKAASALDEACDSATLAERRKYQASQLLASSVDLHGESSDDFVQWWQPSAAHPLELGGGSTATPFAGSKEDLSFHEALSTLAEAVHHPVGDFEHALITGIHRTENESLLKHAEAITDELLSGNRNREPEVARRLLEALASRGLPRSILNLSTSLALGDGGPKDEKRATDLLEQLAESASTPVDLKRIVESRLGPAYALGTRGKTVSQ